MPDIPESEEKTIREKSWGERKGVPREQGMELGTGGGSKRGIKYLSVRSMRQGKG